MRGFKGGPARGQFDGNQSENPERVTARGWGGQCPVLLQVGLGKVLGNREESSKNQPFVGGKRKFLECRASAGYKHGAGYVSTPRALSPAQPQGAAMKTTTNASVARNSETREVMDIRQASDYLGISPDSLYKYASDGFIPAFKLGNRWRFRLSRLEEWMDHQSGINPLPEAEPRLVKPRQKKPVRGTGSRGVAAAIDSGRQRSSRSGTRG